MIIEIMLIILAMISVIVNTIVSVIIIKDTLNNRKYQHKTDKSINITDKDFHDGLADHTYIVAKYNDAMRQAQKLEQNKSEANQNGTSTQATNTNRQNIQNNAIQNDKNTLS